MNATDLADLLVRQGVPFRDAHERAGRVVRAAIEHRCEIEDLPAAALHALLPELRVDLRQELAVTAVLARRRALGGTAPERVRSECARWKQLLTAGFGQN
jgi:argininosuccinate lyase